MAKKLFYLVIPSRLEVALARRERA